MTLILGTGIMSTFLTTLSLAAASQAVVFDFGGVMTLDSKKEAIVHFLRSTFDLSQDEFEKINSEKKIAIQAGKSDMEFWIQFAEQHKISLPLYWTDEFKAVLKEAIAINPEMYVLIAELKAKQLQVALLSNVDERLAKLVREFGMYEPFDPCLLSCEIGVQKPDPKAYELLLKRLNFPPKNIIFIDDMQENVEAAQKAGLDAILFQSVTHLRQELLIRELL